jgi:hypothetical protein
LDVDPSFYTGPVTAREYHSQKLVAYVGNDTGAEVDNVFVQLWAHVTATMSAPSLFLRACGGVNGVTVPASAGYGVPTTGNTFPYAIDKANGLAAMVTDPANPNGPKIANPDLAGHWVNNGSEVHCCIYANLYRAGGPGARIAGDPTRSPGWAPDTSRFHAQRNMSIIRQPAGDPMNLVAQAANSDPEEGGTFVLTVRERPRHILLPWEIEALAATAPWLRVIGRGERGPELVAVVGEERFELPSDPEPLQALELQIEGGDSGQEFKVELGPDEPRPFTLLAEPPKEEFGVRVIDVVQHDLEGQPVGGIRFTWAIAPKEFIRHPRHQ